MRFKITVAILFAILQVVFGCMSKGRIKEKPANVAKERVEEFMSKQGKRIAWEELISSLVLKIPADELKFTPSDSDTLKDKTQRINVHLPGNIDQVVSKDSVYFAYNSIPCRRISPRVEGYYEVDAQTMRSFSFKGKRYLSCYAHIQNCQGTFCRNSINYVFDVTYSEPVQSALMYKNVPNLFYFGDIDHDDLLDGLEFVNSFDSPESFTNEEIKMIDDSKSRTLIKIFPIHYSLTGWNRIGNEYHVLVVANFPEDNQVTVLFKNWP
jgi:hypothetical protein